MLKLEDDIGNPAGRRECAYVNSHQYKCATFWKKQDSKVGCYIAGYAY